MWPVGSAFEEEEALLSRFAALFRRFPRFEHLRRLLDWAELVCVFVRELVWAASQRVSPADEE